MSQGTLHGIARVRRCGGSFIIALPKSTGAQPGMSYTVRTIETNSDQKIVLLTRTLDTHSPQFFSIAPSEP